jgi:signal transduction histidine kinase
MSQLLEILGFSFFFLLLMALIIRKDKIRNDYAEKLKEEAISANKAKSDFLAYTAHEIRSPLGFILTGTEMIQNRLLGDVSDKCKEYIEGISSNAKSILNFIIEILDENKILQNKVYLNKDFHDVTEIILDVIKHNKTKFYSKKDEFITDFQPNLPLLHCDEKKIYQILNNIITNSYKYCKDEILITVKVFLEKQKLFIIIKDNGIGMTSDEIKLAMKRYESINISTNSDSYGLGLSIVKLLIDAHDARLYVDSTKNIGTVITMTFKQKFLKI